MLKKAIFIFFEFVLLQQIEDCVAFRSRACFFEQAYCNPLYLCPCCPKLYFADGTNSGRPTNNGYFCNMENAGLYSEYDPYPIGCCQRCGTVSEGCVDTIKMPCCENHVQTPDPSCDEGLYICQRTTNFTYVDDNSVPPECDGKLPECYTEGMFCDPSIWNCCDNLWCNKEGRKDSWGVCERVAGYEGELPPEPTPLYTLPIAPPEPTCPTYMTTTTGQPTTPTESPPTTLMPTPPPDNCLEEGAECVNGGVCCAGLVCPSTTSWYKYVPDGFGWTPDWGNKCEKPRCYELDKECDYSQPCCEGFCVQQYHQPSKRVRGICQNNANYGNYGKFGK